MRVHESWQDIIDRSLHALDKEYLEFLHVNQDYFPNINNFLNAFKTLPKNKTKAILFGQDPYPRKESAIGYAFIDGRVKTLFSQKGFSKEVNRATSLRNFLKMQLSVEGFLSQDTSQEAIAGILKNSLINSIYELKDNFEKEGILLLNRALIFTCKQKSKTHINSFEPFIKVFLQSLLQEPYDLILFGNEAKSITKLLPTNHNFNLIKTMHPYNISFIKDLHVREYFSKFSLVKKPYV